MDFHLDTLLNLQNVTVFSYSSELDYTILKLQLVNEKMSEDAVQDIFHKVAKLKKKTGEFLSD